MFNHQDRGSDHDRSKELSTYVQMRNSLCLFKVLPNELVSIILAMLGYRDLASCMKVRGLSS
jgi:hypothetical protein